LNRLAGIFKVLAGEKFESTRLRELQNGWVHDGVAASEWLRQLARLLDLLDSREHLIVRMIGPFFLLDTQLAFALEARRAGFGEKIEDWLRRLGEMEALSSLAGHAFEHPADPFPELLPESEPARIQMQGLGHPLIPETRVVRNDLAMDPEHRLIVVSGSNMSGKSTWLRALGVNLALATAGGVVRARRMQLSPLQLGASIRTLDSLNEGISRFYAEIKRLRQIIDLTGEGAVLFLVDEVLQGTNSHDRRIGTAYVVKALLERGAMGLITTHDLALTQIVDETQPRGANFHFEDQFKDGKMSFDYQLRPGVVEKSNALALMRSIGLDVD
jgi:DNA mismatch repair ATPase MutS